MVKEWFEINQKRFLNEIFEMQEKFPDFKIVFWKLNGRERVAFKGSIEINDERQFFGVYFPKNYPFQQPKVGILKDLRKDQKFLVDDGEHINLDYSHCLFPSDGGTHSWRYYYSAAYALDKLLAYYSINKREIEIFEHTSEEFDFPGRFGDFIVFMPIEVVEIIFKKKFVSLKLLESIVNDEKIYWILDNNLDLLRKHEYRFLNEFKFEQKEVICILLTETTQIIKDKAYKFENFCDFFKEYFKVSFSKEFEFQNKNLLLINQNKTAVVYFNLSSDSKPENSPTRIFFNKVKIVSIPETNFIRAKDFLKDTFKELGLCQVTLIGLGSIGSEIAIELGKSGVKNFVLYDYEKLEPENVCRHIGNNSELGLKKVTIVRNHLHFINPNCNVEPISENPVNGVNIAKFRNRVRDSDLVIISTGNYESEMFVNEITTRQRKPAIYCFADENVDIGSIFYYNPPNGPCYECLQSNLDKNSNPNYNEKFNQLLRPDKSQPYPGRSYYEVPGIPGISIDIDFISLIVSKLIITVLSKSNKSFYNFYSIFPEDKSFFLWKNRGNLLDFGLEAYKIEKVPNCYFCSPTGRRYILDSKNQKRLQKIIFKYSKRKLDSEKI